MQPASRLFGAAVGVDFAPPFFRHGHGSDSQKRPSPSPSRVLAARWAAAWFEKSLQRPLLALTATELLARVFERCARTVVAFFVVADALTLLVVGSALPQAVSRIALAATKAASDGALILAEKRFKTAPTLCHPFYCAAGVSLRDA